MLFDGLMIRSVYADLGDGMVQYSGAAEQFAVLSIIHSYPLSHLLFELEEPNGLLEGKYRYLLHTEGKIRLISDEEALSFLTPQATRGDLRD